MMEFVPRGANYNLAERTPFQKVGKRVLIELPPLIVLPFILKGKARLLQNISEMKDLDKPCILVQV